MIDKRKIVHDLALIHAQEKYKELFENATPQGRQFNAGIDELVRFYKVAAIALATQIDKIVDAYLDDDGNPVV